MLTELVLVLQKCISGLSTLLYVLSFLFVTLEKRKHHFLSIIFLSIFLSVFKAFFKHFLSIIFFS